MTFKRSAFPPALGHGGSGRQQLACGHGPPQWALAQPSCPAASCCRPDTESAACRQRPTHSAHRAVHTQVPPGLSSPKPRGLACLLSHGLPVPQLCSRFKVWDSAHTWGSGQAGGCTASLGPAAGPGAQPLRFRDATAVRGPAPGAWCKGHLRVTRADCWHLHSHGGAKSKTPTLTGQ